MPKLLVYLIVLGVLTFLAYRRRYDLRRRLKLAISVVLVSYPLLLILRFVSRPPQEGELWTLAEVFLGFGLVWLVLWLLANRLSNEAR